MDEHVVQLFRDVTKVTKIEIVNEGRAQGIETLQRFGAASEAFKIHIQPAFTWVPFDGGFAHFVDSGELDSFLSR